jgi:hypothetical protein
MINVNKLGFEKYLNGEHPFNGMGCVNLCKNYTWKVPLSLEKLGISIEEKAPFRANLILKTKLNEKWQGADSKTKLKIAKWIVADWGGIRGNSDQTIAKYVKELELEPPKTPYKGVSSYSKILTAIDSRKFAILDARVIVSLNAIQFINRVEEGLYFPYITAGRNKVTGNAGTKTGFAFLPKYNVAKRAINFPKWTIVDHDSSYTQYIKLLEQMQKQTTFQISEIEMALFADAEKLAIFLEPGLGPANLSTA